MDTPRPADVTVDDLFERVFRGYHRKQVEDYVAWLEEQTRTAQDRARTLEAELAEARAEIERLRAG